MAKITNNSRAIRTINVRIKGKVKALSLSPGESAEGEPVRTASFEAAVKGGRLKITQTKTATDAAKVDDMTVDELKAHLADRGVEIPADAKKADLVALAKK